MNRLNEHLNDILNRAIDKMSIVTPESEINSLVEHATDSELREPDIGLNLEFCDLINKKGKNYPRLAANAIVAVINGRSRQSAMLALSLLDYCVKNCGYPFHLVISSKDWLNQFVRRFPERPSSVGPIQHNILELIQQWNASLCVSSRYKSDFKHINDMYRLLSHKGYSFPTLTSENVAVLSTNPTLHTEAELEQQDKDAQGVKLEELLRIGTPAALAQANDLMKIMSGYDTKRIPDYKKEVDDEMRQYRDKVVQLNTILSKKVLQDRWERDSALEDLLASIKSAQSKIQQLISSSSAELRMDHLLLLNDMFNTAISRTADFKEGRDFDRSAIPGSDATFDSAIASSPDAHSTHDNVTAAPDVGAISLIDFEDSNPKGSGRGSPSPPKPQNLLDGLDFFSTTPSLAPPVTESVFMDPFSSLSSTASIPAMAVTLSGSIPVVPSQSSGQLLDLFSGPTHKSAGAVAPSQSPPSQSVKSSDPFASLFSNNMNVGTGGMAAVKPSVVQPIASAALSGAAPSSNKNLLDGFVNASPNTQPIAPKDAILLNKNGLQIKLKQLSVDSLPNGQTTWSFRAMFMNVTPVVFEELNFLLSVPKNCSLRLESLTSTSLAPLNVSPAMQTFHITTSTTEECKFRFKVAYSLNGADVEELGEYSSPSSSSS